MDTCNNVKGEINYAELSHVYICMHIHHYMYKSLGEINYAEFSRVLHGDLGILGMQQTAMLSAAPYAAPLAAPPQEGYTATAPR